MTPDVFAKATGPSNRTAPGLLVPGNILNLYNRPETNNIGIDAQQPAGTHSTTFSKSFNINGKEVLLPTVHQGRFMTDQEAVNRFHQTGEHLGMFDTPENADAYATALHNSQEVMGGFYGGTSKLSPVASALKALPFK